MADILWSDPITQRLADFQRVAVPRIVCSEALG